MGSALEYLGGLAGRLQVFVYPDVVKPPPLVDRVPDFGPVNPPCKQRFIIRMF